MHIAARSTATCRFTYSSRHLLAVRNLQAGVLQPPGPTRYIMTAASASQAGTGVQMGTNVLGGPLACCCTAPMTGYYRDGYCRTGAGDMGVHVVCAQVTAEFLAFTASRGNDLSSPAPWANFPGLKPGDRWCLCASRWAEAAEAGCAPSVVLAATHVRALDHVDLDLLKKYAVDLPSKQDSS